MKHLFGGETPVAEIQQASKICPCIGCSDLANSSVVYFRYCIDVTSVFDHFTSLNRCAANAANAANPANAADVCALV